MIKILEDKSDNRTLYNILVEEDGKCISRTSVQYSSREVILDQSYYYIYDSFMRPVEESFGFLNFFLKDKSPNTKLMYMNALKLLYSYESIIIAEYHVHRS